MSSTEESLRQAMRVSKGDAQLRTETLALWVKLALSSPGKWVAWASLKPLRQASAVTEDDLAALEERGWAERRMGRGRDFSVRMTDGGNEQLRGLLEWLRSTKPHPEY